jgi:hypothetical protein
VARDEEQERDEAKSKEEVLMAHAQSKSRKVDEIPHCVRFCTTVVRDWSTYQEKGI